MSELTEQDLQRLEELTAKTTPGPWEVAEDAKGVTVGPVGENGQPINRYRDRRGRDNAEFIAAAREAVPQLTAAYREMRAERDEFRGSAEKWEYDAGRERGS